MKNNNTEKKPDIDTQAAVQALEYLLAAGYVSRKRLYLENFIRGIMFSVGSVLGATVVISLLIWILSRFNSAPVIGDFIKAIEQSIKSN